MALLRMVVEIPYQQVLVVIVFLGALYERSTEIIERDFFLSRRDKNSGLSMKFILAVINNSI